MDNLDRIPEPEQEPHDFPPIEYMNRSQMWMARLTAFLGTVAGKITIAAATAAVAGSLIWHHAHKKAAVQAVPPPVVHHAIKTHPAKHKVASKHTPAKTTKKKASKKSKAASHKKTASKDKSHPWFSSSSRAQNG